MSRLPAAALKIPAESRERIRLAILELKLRGEKITQRSVREEARVDQRANAVMVKLFKLDKLPPLGQPWASGVNIGPDSSAGSSPGPSESQQRDELERLVERIRTARSDEDREQIQQEACALFLMGVLDKGHVDAVEKTLKEARQSAKAKRDSGGDQDPDQFCMAGEEAYLLVRAYEGMVDDERRERVLAYVAQEAQEDLRENPNVDRGIDAESA